MIQRGNCYVTSEALYHLLGGKRAGWTAQYMKTKATGNHWFLKHKSGLILDATRKQFPKGIVPDYTKARGIGFLTAKPSKKAKLLMEDLVWQWCKR
jgi:hypothetical protein